MSDRVQRIDAGELRGTERTPQGGLRVTAALTRTGVFTYRDAAGTEWREYRPPASVFGDAALATLRGAPVTDLHPDAMVTSENWAALAKGHVGDDVRREGDFIVATLLVQDANEVAMIERGERREISLGYEAAVERTPGVSPDGERYDAVQTSLKHNHVGIGPVGWGRAGADVSLRLDGAAIEVRADAPTKGTGMSLKIKIRGKEYRCDDAAEMAAAQTAADAPPAMTPTTDETAGIKAALMEALQKIAMLEAKLAIEDATETPDAEANEEAESVALDAKIAVREKLRADARKVLGADAALDGKSERAIHAAVVAKVLPSVKLDALDAKVVAGMFVALTQTQRNDALGAAHADALSATGAREDTYAAAKARGDQATFDRGRRPLGTKGA